MSIFSQLQFSLNKLFDIYRKYGKRLYGFSALFAILSSIWNVLLGSLIILAFNGIENTFNFQIAELQLMNFSESFIFNITMVSVFLAVINLSFYALFLIRFSENDSISLSFSGFFGTFQATDWLNYLGFAIGGSLLYLIALYTFSLSSGMSDSAGSLAVLIGTPGWDRMLSGFLLVVLDYLPGLFGVVIIYLHLKRLQLIRLTSKEFRATAITVFIIGTILFITSSKIIAFIQFFIGGIISLPFVEPIIPSLIMVAIYLFLISSVYPGLAACFAAPFLYYKSEDNSDKPLKDSTLIDE